jgi:glycosyltransferase involved in cell wall biosynthesis
MVQSLINLGVDATKVSTITHGIDPAIFHNTNQTKSNDKFFITSTRSFEDVYNIPHLIKSFAAACNTQPNLHLNLIGSGSLLEQIEKLVEELGIGDKVTYFGRLTQSEMAEVLNLSHVFVTVSKSDGDVVSLAEGMACNNFCITSDIPANRFWIEENKNGYFVPIDDVDALTNKILLAHTNYQELMKTATPTNEAVLLSKGIWGNNMKKVEAMYLKLTQQ